MHGRWRKANFLEYAVECRPHLWVYAGAKESLMDRSEKFGPQERPGAKGKQRSPGGLLEGEDSSGANKASQRAQDRSRIRKKHQNEPTDGRVEEFVTVDLVHIRLGEVHVPKSSFSHTRLGSRNRTRSAFDAHYLTRWTHDSRQEHCHITHARAEI